MKVEEFTAQVRRHVDRFEAWWKTRTQETPQVFPADMPWSEWVEQFLLWEDDDSPQQRASPCGWQANEPCAEKPTERTSRRGNT
jgi:hypothetical protein